MSDIGDVTQDLTLGAQHLVKMAVHKRRDGGHEHLGVYHWLLSLIERHWAMAEDMVQGLEAAVLRQHLREQLQQGEVGAPLDLEVVIRQAGEHTRERGKTRTAERDLAAVILTAAGYEVIEASSSFLSAPVNGSPAENADTGHRLFDSPALRRGWEEAMGIRPDRTTTPRARHPTPVLDKFGRDLTRDAEEGRLSSVVGREVEVQLVIETLHRRTKRNPVLVGPAGVGKTAIAEELAQRVVAGEVPETLRGVRIILIQPSTLVAGAKVMGELQKRMEALLSEARQDEIILFVDEVHAIVGAGGMPGTSDIGSLLKPALARGDIACIAATTDDEYRRFIEPEGDLRS